MRTNSDSRSNLSFRRRTVLQSAGIAGLGLFAGTGYVDGHTNPNEYDQPLAYVGTTQSLTAINANTGEIEWELTEPEGNLWSSPTVVDGVAYTGDNDGRL